MSIPQPVIFSDPVLILSEILHFFQRSKRRFKRLYFLGIHKLMICKETCWCLFHRRCRQSRIGALHQFRDHPCGDVIDPGTRIPDMRRQKVDRLLDHGC